MYESFRSFFFLRKQSRHSYFILTISGLLIGKVPLRFFSLLLLLLFSFCLFFVFAYAFFFKMPVILFRNNKFSSKGISICLLICFVCFYVFLKQCLKQSCLRKVLKQKKIKTILLTFYGKLLSASSGTYLLLFKKFLC